LEQGELQWVDRDQNGIILGKGRPMKRLMLLMLTVLIVTVPLAKSREWQTGTIALTSENDVSWPLWGEKDTLHYTIETSAMIYFAEYTYKPGQHNNSHGPNIALNMPTRIAIEGKHAYTLDANGREVKLHIVRKTAK
jgi:hypothetical protein